MIHELLDELNALQAQVRRGRAVNVNDTETKEATIGCGSSYFTRIRPLLVQAFGESPDVLAHDEGWQTLIKLAHSNNARRSYGRIIASLKKQLSALNVAYLCRVSDRGIHGTSLSDLTPAEKLIVDTLDDCVPSAAASYRQGILDLRSAQRLSYRGTASEFRETLRETLDHLAPDKEVAGEPGFEFEGGQTRPTMKQKARFILRSRQRSKTQQQVVEKSMAVVDGLTSEIAKAIYDRASLAVHVETSRNEVMKIKRYVDTILFDLLEISEAT